MVFTNNTCVAQSALYTSCTTTTDGTGQVLKNNRFFIDNKAYSGGDMVPGFECGGGNWSAWLETGQDAGSTVSGEVPAVAEMVSWGEALLGF